MEDNSGYVWKERGKERNAGWNMEKVEEMERKLGWDEL